MLSPPDTPEQLWCTSSRVSSTSAESDSGAGSGRAMSHLPLKKRELSMRHGDGGDEDSDGSKTNSPKYGETDGTSELPSNSPPDTPPSQYASSYSNYPSSMSHMAPALEDASMSPSRDVSNSSLPSTSGRHEVPENLESFFPEDIFPLMEKKPSSGSDGKSKKKKKSFAYFIKGKAVNELGEKLANSGSRSRHGSNSSAGPSHVTLSNVAETLDMAQYAAVPSSPVMPSQRSPDFYPRTPSYGRGCEGPSIHDSLFPSTSLLQMPHHAQFSSPNHFGGGVGVFPGMLPAGDLDESSQPSTSGGVRKKKPQQCRYCANHYLYEPVKGHKYSCRYRECPCAKCLVTRNRQLAVREQAKLTRQQENMRLQQQQRQHHLGSQPFGVVDPTMHPVTAEMVRDLDLHDPRSRQYDEDDDDDY